MFTANAVPAIRDDRAMIALNRQGIAFARDAARDCAIPAAWFDPAGKVDGAAGDAAHAPNLSYAAPLGDPGEACELLDAQAMAELAGSRHFRSGLLTPGTVMLQPAGYVRGLGRGLRAHVDIHENAPVAALTRKGVDWQVAADRGAATAPLVILAANGRLESFGFAKGRLMQLFLSASTPPELAADAPRRLGGASRWGGAPSDPMGATLRRIDAAQEGERIVIRARAPLRCGMQARGPIRPGPPGSSAANANGGSRSSPAWARNSTGPVTCACRSMASP